MNEREEITEPSYIKMIELKDMKKYRKNLSYTFLRQHGFTKDEYLWLKRNNKL